MREIRLLAPLWFLISVFSCTAQRHCVDATDKTERTWSKLERVESRAKANDCGRWSTE